MPFDTLGQCNQDLTAFGIDPTWSPDTSLLHRTSKPEQIVFSPHDYDLLSAKILSLDSSRYHDDIDDDEEDLSQLSPVSSTLSDPPIETLHAALSRFRLSFTETGKSSYCPPNKSVLND